MGAVGRRGIGVRRVFHLDGVSGMRKGRRKIDYRHYIAVLITAGMLACWLLFPGALGRLTESFRDIANSIAYYFNELFDLGFNVAPTVNELPVVLPEGPSFLPDNFEEFQANWVCYWQLWATRENVTDYLYFLVSGLFYFSQGLLIFLPLVLLVRMLVKRNARKKNNDHGKESRALRAYKAVAGKVSVIRAWVLSFIGFLKEHPPYLIAWVLLWLFYFNVYTIVIEFAAFYLYFIVSFDVLNIYRQVYKLFLDLQAPLGVIPLWAWLLLGLCLFLQWRKSIGYMVLEHHERKNRGFINEQPIALLTTGVMRSGKDLMDTDMVLSIEILFRNKALELMQKIDMQYPDFPWLRLEKALQRGIRENRIYNLASCKRYIRQRQAFYERYLSYGTDYGKLKYILYGYDVARYGEERDDKLKVTYLFDALENYAKLYFIYVIECSLIYSNLAVRGDFRLLDNGNFPLWRFDLFRTPSVRRGDGSYYSHILDMDALRDGKKVIEHSKASLEFGIVYISEIQNERKNDLGLREVKANAEGANQKNDGFENRLKTIGHGATVMGCPFVRFLGNAQRPEDWGARGREVCSILRIKERSEMRLALPFFSLEELLYSVILPKFTERYLDHRYRRGDMTLPMYLFKQAVSKLCRYYTGVYNTFGYMVQKVTVEAGTMDGKAKEKKYYLAAKKVYASRYKTDFLATVYEAKALATGQGITTAAAYVSLMPELKEMKQVNSYYYDELIGDIERIQREGEEK